MRKYTEEQIRTVLENSQGLRHITQDHVTRFGNEELSIEILFGLAGMGDKSLFGRILLENGELEESTKIQRMTNLINHSDKYRVTYDERQTIIRNLNKYYV